MQDESAEKSSHAQRLDRLRVETQATWAEVAKETGLSESMIYQVKSGARQLSLKAEHRLAIAERKAGLSPTLRESFKHEVEPDRQWALFGRMSTAERLELLEKDLSLWNLWFQIELNNLDHRLGQQSSQVEELIGITREISKKPSDKKLIVELNRLSDLITAGDEEIKGLLIDHFELMREVGQRVRRLSKKDG